VYSGYRPSVAHTCRSTVYVLRWVVPGGCLGGVCFTIWLKGTAAVASVRLCFEALMLRGVPCPVHA
jgi:hypothetical protein